MPSDRSLLERELQRVELRPFTLDGFHRDRERKQRNRRMSAGVVALVVTLAGAAILARALTSEPIPAEETQRPSPSPAPPTATGLVWPQTSLEEVRRAQERADAGSPDFAWQVDPLLRLRDPSSAELFTRFVEAELGWEASEAIGISDFGDVGVLRCEPGETNPLYPTDIEAGRCAPTIDEHRYEMVAVHVKQPVRQDATGIWVVTGYEMLEPYEQVTPPTEEQTTELLEGFLQARIDGAGAEEYVDTSALDADGLPFLYAAPNGAPYERAEFDVVESPLWPDGRMRFEVRLFADGGATVVEQVFRMDSPALGLWYDDEPDLPGTTVNGQDVPVPTSVFGGDVTFQMIPPWVSQGSDDSSQYNLMTDDFQFDAAFQLLDSGPLVTACDRGSAPVDAQQLAETIASNPALGATDPVAVRIGGVPAVQIDMSNGLDDTCKPPEKVEAPNASGTRVRLYLVDLPSGSTGRILALMFISREESFDRLVEVATPLVDTIQIHPS